jgi:hypothetical protein
MTWKTIGEVAQSLTDRLFRCAHPKLRIVWTRFSNGGDEYQRPQLRNFCDDCGWLVGSALKHSLATDASKRQRALSACGMNVFVNAKSRERRKGRSGTPTTKRICKAKNGRQGENWSSSGRPVSVRAADSTRPRKFITSPMKTPAMNFCGNSSPSVAAATNAITASS